MKLRYLAFDQPIGEFALTVMAVTDILAISSIDRREFDQVTLASRGGPQREASENRINEIAKYAGSADATFPTPILLSVPEGYYEITSDHLVLEDDRRVASVVDGQHRLLGLQRSRYRNEYVLPVVFILGATEEQKALIFAIINGKQTRVSASVIYDLFEVVEGRSPAKTAHEIARAMNQDEDSPFYRRLKMLGKRFRGSKETLSQGTFVTQLLRHISSNPSDDLNRARANRPLAVRPNCIFNRYFINEQDEVILRIMYNLFSSIRAIFPVEWNEPDSFILSKTTGYTGVMKALPRIYRVGHSLQNLSGEYFSNLFAAVRLSLERDELELTSNNFPPNNIGESLLT